MHDACGKSVTACSKVNSPHTPVSTYRVRVCRFEESTVAIMAKIETYMVLTPYDKQRPILVKELQLEGNKWTSKYAPGGSSKKESGRAFYNALSELLGHIAFNGLAPMRGSTVVRTNPLLFHSKQLDWGFVSLGMPSAARSLLAISLAHADCGLEGGLKC
jgi:hypothetical protein